FSISGTKYEDLTGNGTSADDTPWSYGPVTIYIDDDNSHGLSAGDRTTTTDANGHWSISGLTLADVGKSIYEVVPGGSEQTGTLVQTIDNPGSGGTDTGNDFTNFRNFSISGTKYLDKTGDGITADDVGLGKIKIYIDLNDNKVFNWTDSNHNGVWDSGEGDQWTTTADDGTWSFNDLGPGYAGKTVYEVLPNGYVQTVGQDGYTIVGTSGHDETGLDFANYLFKPAYTLTQGYWGSHTDAWDGKDGLGKTTSSSDVAGEANPNKNNLLILGDTDHDGNADDGVNLTIDLKLAQSLESSAKLGDPRAIMLAQLIATQLNINNDWNKYHVADVEPQKLVVEAITWLKDTGGILADGVLSSSEATVSKNQVVLGAGGGSWNGTWGSDKAVFPADGSGPIMVNGQDIANALAWFNQGQLVVSQDGANVAWNNNGTFENMHANALDNFWHTLSQEHVV
ncbi:hypothetical protein, partial [Bradyrhizobium elkanii]|uniref:hypothetical protein n=1 Tax=Bradyrhizobium elkanii TaxID=29448 RepID=UPI001AED38ED